VEKRHDNFAVAIQKNSNTVAHALYMYLYHRKFPKYASTPSVLPTEESQ